jgi:hypothetical protein
VGTVTSHTCAEFALGQKVFNVIYGKVWPSVLHPPRYLLASARPGDHPDNGPSNVEEGYVRRRRQLLHQRAMIHA